MYHLKTPQQLKWTDLESIEQPGFASALVDHESSSNRSSIANLEGRDSKQVREQLDNLSLFLVNSRRPTRPIITELNATEKTASDPFYKEYSVAHSLNSGQKSTFKTIVDRIRVPETAVPGYQAPVHLSRQKSSSAPTQRPTRQTNQSDAWIGIKIRDDQGNPLPEINYLIKDADGNEHTGTTDAQGMARIMGINAGKCEISLPDVDDWR